MLHSSLLTHEGINSTVQIGPLNDTVDVKKATAGQFKLTWMSRSELSQAMRILEDKEKEQKKEEYSTLTKAMETAMAKKREEEEMQYQNSCW